VSPNLCVKRLFLEWGERGEGGGRRGGGRDRERRGIWGEKGDGEKRGGRQVGRGGRKVGSRGARMKRVSGGEGPRRQRIEWVQTCMVYTVFY